jgi:membrane protein DedA with SNARE-associated domain
VSFTLAIFVATFAGAIFGVLTTYWVGRVEISRRERALEGLTARLLEYEHQRPLRPGESYWQ